MSLGVSAWTFLTGFLTWFWPVLILIALDQSRVLDRWLMDGTAPNQPGFDLRAPGAQLARWLLLLLSVFLASFGSYRDMRSEMQAQIVRLEAELFRVGVVRSEQLERESGTTWKAQSEIGRVIQLSIDGTAIPLTGGAFDVERDRILLHPDRLPEQPIIETASVELIYMARHSPPRP